MRAEGQALLSGAYKEKRDLNIWQWAQENIDFSRAPDYETFLHSIYDPDLMPIYREPMETITDPNIRETWVLKCARAGATENLLLMSMRYHICEAPIPMQYISGDQVAVERMTRERIKKGMKLAPALLKKYREAQALEHQIYFKDCSLVVTWPKNKMAFKQSGYALILADEVSVWPDYSADMMRKRTDTYHFSHIVGISSPDPQQKRSSSEDPIFQEFSATDQRYWFMPDPGAPKKKKAVFKFEMGSIEKGYGLRWNPTAKNDAGEWDLKEVEKSAYYLTPAGAELKEKDRLDLIAAGQWVATRADAPPDLRGYHVNSFYLPFHSFGKIAVAFLKAKKKGKKYLKAFVYEWLAEKWYDDKEETTEEKLDARAIDYHKGKSFTKLPDYSDRYIGKTITRLLTADVQKGHLWAVCREWIEGGDSGLLDWRYIPDFPQLEQMAQEYNAHKVYVDVGYRIRQQEVYEYCYEYEGAFPTFGSDNLVMPFKLRNIDPFEGKSGGGSHAIAEYVFNADIMKMLTLDLINGEGNKNWYVYKPLERQYSRGVISEARVNGKWEILPGRQNHLWDCEVLQTLGAMIEGIYISDWVT